MLKLLWRMIGPLSNNICPKMMFSIINFPIGIFVCAPSRMAALHVASFFSAFVLWALFGVYAPKPTVHRSFLLSFVTAATSPTALSRDSVSPLFCVQFWPRKRATVCVPKTFQTLCMLWYAPAYLSSIFATFLASRRQNHICMFIDVHTDTHTPMNAHAHTHAHTHCVYTHARARARTHLHLHFCICPLSNYVGCSYDNWGNLRLINYGKTLSWL